MEVPSQGVDWISALGGPSAVGAILIYLVKRTMASVTKSLDEVVTSSKAQAEALADIKTRMAIHEAQAVQVQRSLETLRAMEKASDKMEGQIAAAFRIIDDLRSQVSGTNSELLGIRETLARNGK